MTCSLPLSDFYIIIRLGGDTLTILFIFNPQIICNHYHVDYSIRVIKIINGIGLSESLQEAAVASSTLRLSYNPSQ